MSNPFSTDNLVPNWSEAARILKGDKPGHPFHGNQYVSLPSGGPMSDRQIKDHITELVEAGRATDSNRWVDNQRVNSRNPVDIFGVRHAAPGGPDKARRVNMMFQFKGQEMLDAMEKDPTLTVEKYASDLREKASDLLSKTKDDAPTLMAYWRNDKSPRYTDADEVQEIIDRQKNEKPWERDFDIRAPRERDITNWVSDEHNDGDTLNMFADYLHGLRTGSVE
ncbi:MAG: hypothetical protein EBR81_14860, partial [Proteobacteria bacterium]|nr:hypothetical protein [Pseudomonadota bacterium]